MARPSTMDPALKEWLSHTVYPKLSHDQVFGNLPNFAKAQYSETRYADCPRCHRAGKFYMIPGRPLGSCDSCSATITWWAYLKFDHDETETIARIGRLAGVEPPSDPDHASESDEIIRA